MHVKIIGGHGGVSPGYRATSYLIDDVLLIDAGSVASGIAIKEQVQIDHILISHAHLDHISDLAFLADNCFGMKGKPFEIHASPEVADTIMTHLLNDKIWPDFTKLPNEQNPTLRMNRFESEGEFVIGEYKIFPVAVNHQGGAQGFLIEKAGKSLLFTQDTGPTDLIWQYAQKRKNLQAIFTEVSFPNAMVQIAIDSQHHTPHTMEAELKKMPSSIPIYLGHLKPNFEKQLIAEIQELEEERFHILGSENRIYHF
jgi:ribonuclease BN (tRNA processing enzyme)